jgi:hypothetical protein
MATRKNILLVEGKDDLNVVAHLLRHHLAVDKVEEVVKIEDRESIVKLFSGLRNDWSAASWKGWVLSSMRTSVLRTVGRRGANGWETCRI